MLIGLLTETGNIEKNTELVQEMHGKNKDPQVNVTKRELCVLSGRMNNARAT